MKLYRGMSELEYLSRSGLARKGDQITAQLFAGDKRIGAGDAGISVGGPSLDNALAMHTASSTHYALAFLSFSASFDVAAYFSLQKRWEMETHGIVVETNLKILRAAGIQTALNSDRYPWEEETSLNLKAYEKLPDQFVAEVHRIDLKQLRKSAINLTLKWPTAPGVPNFLEKVGSV